MKSTQCLKQHFSNSGGTPLGGAQCDASCGMYDPGKEVYLCNITDNDLIYSEWRMHNVFFFMRGGFAEIN